MDREAKCKIKICGRTPCYEHCQESKNGKHKPDPRSISIANGVDWCIDVNCSLCGVSGSVAISPKDVVFE